MTPDTSTTNELRPPIDPITLRSDPSPATVTVDYHGVPVTFRPVNPSDVRILGDYFLSLSDDTKRRYGPHPFDRATAENVCATTDPTRILRMIATVNGPSGEQAIAYILLIL